MTYTDEPKKDQPTAPKPKPEPVVDSEGLRVVTLPDESTPDEGVSLNAAAKEAVEAENDAAAQEAANIAAYEEFLNR